MEQIQNYGMRQILMMPPRTSSEHFQVDMQGVTSGLSLPLYMVPFLLNAGHDEPNLLLFT